MVTQFLVIEFLVYTSLNLIAFWSILKSVNFWSRNLKGMAQEKKVNIPVIYFPALFNAHRQSQEPEICSTQIGSGFTRKHKTRLDRLASDSSVIQTFVNYDHKNVL
jgi:hypothetical protein